MSLSVRRVEDCNFLLSICDPYLKGHSQHRRIKTHAGGKIKMDVIFLRTFYSDNPNQLFGF